MVPEDGRNCFHGDFSYTQMLNFCHSQDGSGTGDGGRMAAGEERKDAVI